MVILIIKYTYDWDKGYIYTYKDILFCSVLGLISIITIYILSNYIN